MIQLTDTLFIKADENQYILGTPRRKPDKPGEGAVVVLDKPSYYGTLAQALRGAVAREMRRRVAADEITTLAEYAKQLENLHADFTSRLNVLEA